MTDARKPSEKPHVATCEYVDGKFVRQCTGLTQSWNEYYVGSKRQRGLSMMQLMNLETGKRTRDLMVLKEGEHRAKGLVLNFCPFCGVKIKDDPEPSHD